MKNGTCLAPVALTTIEPVRNKSGSVLWKRVPGFMPWLGHYAPGLTNRELRLAIRARHGVMTTLGSVESLRRAYDLAMTPEARRRAYGERDGRPVAPRPRRLRMLVGRVTVRNAVSEVTATALAVRS